MLKVIFIKIPEILARMWLEISQKWMGKATMENIFDYSKWDTYELLMLLRRMCPKELKTDISTNISAGMFTEGYSPIQCLTN